MTEREQFLLQKRLAIIGITVNAANQIRRSLKIAYPKKRIFPNRNRTPKKRIQKTHAKANTILIPIISATQILNVVSQPIPKFKPGGNIPSGPAIVNQNGIEVIQTNNGTIPAISNK